MTDFATIHGFEDVWRPPVRPRRRTPEAVLARRGHPPADTRAKLARLVGRAPEVMVKVTGRTRDGEHLRAHLDYISRRGMLEMDGAYGERLQDRDAIREIGEAWDALALADSRTRVDSPRSLSIVLSMPHGVDAIAVRDSARAWAAAVLEGRFDYLLTLHTDAGHPHVHLAVCARGAMGERLNPKKADLEEWRQVFAQALRERGVEAEATPRRTRGITRKAERTPLRKLRERYEAGHAALPRVRRGAYQHAAKLAFQGRGELEPWETRLIERQRQVRSLYLAQAGLLQRSTNSADHDLGFRLEAFVRAMPAPDTQALALARELREVKGVTPPRDPARDRSR